LELLDPRGDAVLTLGKGAGLVAATAEGSGEPTWLITGTDPAGVAAAAAAVTPSALHDHFALAVQGHRRLPVPLRPTT
jgi:predicted nicotinamide N-methyase